MSKAPNSQPSEADVTPQVLQAFEAAGAKLYRNNIGAAKFGPRWVAFGVFGKGGPDHVGFLPVRITKEMVGHHIAVFCAPEIKRPIGGRYGDKQVEYRDMIRAAGGIAGFTTSWEQARSLVQDWFNRFSKKNVERQIKKA